MVLLTSGTFDYAGPNDPMANDWSHDTNHDFQTSLPFTEALP